MYDWRELCHNTNKRSISGKVIRQTGGNTVDVFLVSFEVGNFKMRNRHLPVSELLSMISLD